MKQAALLVLVVFVVASVACRPAALVEKAEFPTGTATASQNTATAAAPPTAVVPATATLKPESSPAATLSAVAITPTEQTLPAGASTSFFVSAPKWTAGLPPLHWSAAGLLAGVTAEFLPDANPANATLVISTPCTLPRGSYDMDVRATISSTATIGKATLNVTDRLVDVRPGSFAGSFVTNTISVRRGGPSTERSGPFLRLQFCASPERRTLSVHLQSAISEAGTPMAEPPRFSLFKNLVFPAPDYLQTVSGGYRANAQEVANNDGWNLNWNIADGVYVLAFQRSPFESSLPAEKRPATVIYSVDIRR